MTELAGFTHVVEDVLDDIRSRTIITEAVVDILLESIDIIKEMLEARADGLFIKGHFADKGTSCLTPVRCRQQEE